jgi:hypothetical protein
MSYYIDIIDQELNGSLFVIEKTSKAGVVLAWSGSDEKDSLKVVGSALSFDILHSELVDAKFIRFFTGNEIRFKVELRNQSDDALIWTGHLIPDTYSEPYTNNVTFVKITATCGLGRLKGKKLPESYYRDEKSVIDILCKILSLTGLKMDLFFNPAIENTLEKSYKNIFLDTLSFVDGKKKKDAYNILETLMNDMLCVCFQADGRWNIEGINQRSIRSYKAKLYDFEGRELKTLEGLRLSKKITPLVTPYITIIPPYNEITVKHPRVPQGLPATIAKEKNDGWALLPGVKGEIYATDWNGNNKYYAKAMAPNYYVSFLKHYYWEYPALGGIPITIPFAETDFINLKNKIFVNKYQKITIQAVFRLLTFGQEKPIDVNAYINPFNYQFLLNDTILFGNLNPNSLVVSDNQNLIFIDGEAKLNFETIVPEEGLIDIKLYRSGQNVYTSNCIGFEIKELAINPVAFNEELDFVDLINDEYTIDKELELTYADDDTAFSNCLRLAKLKEATMNFNAIEIPVKYGFSQSGNYYSVVDLDGANLIKDNINTTIYEGAVLENLEVVYNYNASEQMVVKTDIEIKTGSFIVNVYKNDDFLGSRKAWLQWTDAIYKIESNRYAKTIANIIRRMFQEPSEKLDVVALNAVKFNDLILFHYVNEKQFVVTNCSWNLDENQTTLTLSRSVYRDSGNTGPNPENIPPIVNAGIDIVLLNNETTAALTAVAYDTDGFIVSQKWTKVFGGVGDVVDSPNTLETALRNLTEDLYEYQIQVTDNDGATAVDTVKLIRRKSYAVSLLLVYNESQEVVFCKYKFQIDPNIDPSFNMLLKGKAVLFAYNRGNTFFKIVKNNVVIYEYYSNYGSIDDLIFSVGYISTDEIIFEIFQSGGFPDIHFGGSWVEINSIEFISGSGDFTGLPVKAQPVPNPFEDM